MKDKILEMMNNQSMWFDFGITKEQLTPIEGREVAAKEITAHVMEFIAWLSQNAEPRVNDKWAVLNSDYTTYTTMSVNEAYQYWLNDVKK